MCWRSPSAVIACAAVSMAALSEREERSGLAAHATSALDAARRAGAAKFQYDLTEVGVEGEGSDSEYRQCL